ncbi:hypothetical protein AAFF_G00159550 [Aldrovandia affinis]|uniref:BHLH domain-containing protein n=1 Tax=Aldrovandia affinis TaxID=143900 RepID=A0AAD7R1C1_9TELE|nr:hypothetical protein AAFF_G00159550 [Aldrovandia affinis]
MNYSKEHLTLTNKLRKPMVEKMRRDRINSSIEQLKVSWADRAPQAEYRLQAGESRHPGDDSLLPEAAAPAS